MSKSAIGLLITWIVIGLVLAFGGGYYTGMKITEKKMQEGIQKEGNLVKPGEGQPTPTNTDSNKNIEGSSSFPSASPGQVDQKTIDQPDSQPSNIVK